MSGALQVALVGAFPATVAAAIGVWNHYRIQSVHVLVNSQMTEALNRIDKLERRLVAVGEDPQAV